MNPALLIILLALVFVFLQMEIAWAALLCAAAAIAMLLGAFLAMLGRGGKKGFTALRKDLQGDYAAMEQAKGQWPKGKGIAEGAKNVGKVAAEYAFAGDEKRYTGRKFWKRVGEGSEKIIDSLKKLFS